MLPALFSMDPGAVQAISDALKSITSAVMVRVGTGARESPSRGQPVDASWAGMPDICLSSSGAGAAVDWGDGEAEEDVWTDVAERVEDDCPMGGRSVRSPRQTRALLVVLQAAQQSKGEG